MERREFLMAATGAVATGLSAGLFSKQAHAGSVDVSDLVFTFKKGDVKGKAILDQLAVVAKTAMDCVAAGNACAQHCQEQLLDGNQDEFAKCAVAVNQMLSICENTARLAASKATIIQAFLAGCVKACSTCRAACREHEAHFAHGMHAECERCMKSCNACIDACVKLQGLLTATP